MAINQRSLVWLGPASSPCVTADFLNLLRKAPALNGDVYAGMDLPENIADLRAEFATKRGCFSNFEDVPFKSLFPPATWSRMQAGVEKAQKKESGPGGNAIIVDVTQSETRPRVSSLLPPSTKSSQLVSATREHIFTASEVDFAMGWPTLLMGDSYKYMSVLPTCLKELSSNVRKKLAGNGMCLQQVMAWFCYVTSHIVCRSQALLWQPPLHRSSHAQALCNVPPIGNQGERAAVHSEEEASSESRASKRYHWKG